MSGAECALTSKAAHVIEDNVEYDGFQWIVVGTVLIVLTICTTVGVVKANDLAYAHGYKSVSNNAPVCYGPACEVCK